MDPVLGIVSVALLACVFAGAVVHKVTDYERFLDTLGRYAILPPVLVRPAGLAVTVLETCGCLLLLDPRVRPIGAGLLGLLLFVYLLALVANLARGRRALDCGCTATSGRQPLTAWLPVRNGVLIGFAWIAAQEISARPLAAADWATAVLASLTLVTLYLSGEVLLANWAKLAPLRHRHD